MGVNAGISIRTLDSSLIVEFVSGVRHLLDYSNQIFCLSYLRLHEYHLRFSQEIYLFSQIYMGL
jgi:hypothetical protein